MNLSGARSPGEDRGGGRFRPACGSEQLKPPTERPAVSRSEGSEAHRPTLHELEHGVPFVDRHIGPRPDELATMLAAVGVASLDELADRALPAAIRDRDDEAAAPLPAGGVTPDRRAWGRHPRPARPGAPRRRRRPDRSDRAAIPARCRPRPPRSAASGSGTSRRERPCPHATPGPTPLSASPRAPAPAGAAYAGVARRRSGGAEPAGGCRRG